ncbi:hypothetical protein P9112_000917 [Eukaryota sp. TZLM1-RC]
MPDCDPNLDPKDSLISLGPLSIAIGVGLMFGLALSHLPQYTRIIKRKSSKGLSGTTLLVANLNHFNVALGSVLLNLVRFQACPLVGFWKCFPSILSSLTLITGFAAFFPVLILFLMYFEVRDGKRAKSYRRFKLFFLLFLLYAVSIILVSGALVYFRNRCDFIVLEIAYSVGVISTVVNMWQWIPQIIITYKRKGGGALSLTMISIQAPGSALMLVFQITSKASITTWGSYFTSAVQQLILLYLLIYYAIKKSRREKRNKLRDQEDPNIDISRSPLLSYQSSLPNLPLPQIE